MSDGFNSLEEAMAVLSVWKKYRKKETSPLEKNIIHKPTYEVDYYREAVFYRFIELVESSYELYQKDNLNSSAILARSAQETLAVLYYINFKLSRSLEEKEIAGLTESIFRLSLGDRYGKNSGDPGEGFPDAVSVLTMINKVDVNHTGGKFRSIYDQLSEYTHPNHEGVLMSYVSKMDMDTLNISYGEYQRNGDGLRIHIGAALKLFIGMLELALKDYELLINKVLRLSFDLYNSGELREQIEKRYETIT